jgi:hypothetical protein
MSVFGTVTVLGVSPLDEGPVTQVKNLTSSQVVVKVGKYISCFSSQNSLNFQFKTVFETVSQFPNANLPTFGNAS